MYLATAAWLFIWFIVAIDVAFARNNASMMPSWELNPVMAWLAVRFGATVPIVVRIMTVAILSELCKLATIPVANVATAVVFVGHVGILIWYIYGWVGVR
jgi:hypothetical protein